MAYNARIKKETVDVVIRTPFQKIEGTIHRLKNDRILDLLNKDTEIFLPVSNAKVYEIETGKLLFQAKFLAVNKNHIVHVIDNYSLPPEG